MPEGGFVDPDAPKSKKTDPNKSTFPTATAKPAAITGAVGQDLIKIRHPVRGQDASGARVVAYESWEADVIKAVFVTIAQNSVAAAKTHQFGHEGELINYKLVCGLRLHYRDQVLWLSQQEIYTVIRAVRNKDDTTLWDHLVTEFVV